MKKLIAFLLSLTMVLALAACSPAPEATDPSEAQTTAAPTTEPVTEPATQPETQPEAPETTGETLSADDQDLMEKMEALTAGALEEMMVSNTPLTEETFEYSLFIPYIEGAHAVENAAMINAIAHSVVLLKLPEGADVSAVASEIEENMNPRKWICVAAESAWVKTSGQYVLMVMSSQQIADTIEANFDTVFGK